MAQTGMPLHTQKNVKPRLLDQVRQTIRRKHYSLRTEATYIDWIKRYIFFHRKRHPKEMGAAEMEQVLNYLASFASKVGPSSRQERFASCSLV